MYQDITLREYEKSDVDQAIEIWNRVVEDGVAFPQTECLTVESGHEFFLSQTYTGVAFDANSGRLAGIYILHPNNIGRCGHICNASYAVDVNVRGQRIGEKLVVDCKKVAKEKGFRILQFNAVVKTNTAALKLYEKLGFVQLGVIPGGFLMKDGRYEDIIPQFCVL